MKKSILTPEAVQRALAPRDLTNPEQGDHAIQILIREILQTLQKEWACQLKIYRESPVVSIADNYDRLRYPPDGAARDARYTRYISATELLRTSTSAMVPKAMQAAAEHLPDDILLACPGLVYRRDCIDRLHLGEIHQVDLWRICRTKNMAGEDMREMIGLVVNAALPGREYRLEARVHPYTLDGLQIDVRCGEEWIEIGECGLAHPEIIAENIPNIDGLTGLAMGLGMDRILMIRKGMNDVRLVASENPKIAAQMLDLEPYREVSAMPPVKRDLSIVAEEKMSVEELGDKVREALDANANIVETVEILSETAYDDLPSAALQRLGIRPGQINVLLRITLRDLNRTLTNEKCNVYRDMIYAALHKGTSWEWAVKTWRSIAATGNCNKRGTATK